MLIQQPFNRSGQKGYVFQLEVYIVDVYLIKIEGLHDLHLEQPERWRQVAESFLKTFNETV
jgi:hypothetical protein